MKLKKTDLPTDTKLSRFISTLPKTPEGVANWLQSNGYTGHRGDTMQCPLARCLKDRLQTPFVAVRSITIETQFDYGEGFTKPCKPRMSADFTMPPHLFDFVCAFDAGRFPELECA